MRVRALETCGRVITITVDEYRHVRMDPRQFAVVPEHFIGTSSELSTRTIVSPWLRSVRECRQPWQGTRIRQGEAIALRGGRGSLESGDTGAIQLMNFSQTKGREADAVILSYGSGDWYGSKAQEPYDDASRLLYVSMTRARRVVIVMLPPRPHALVRPFIAY